MLRLKRLCKYLCSAKYRMYVNSRNGKYDRMSDEDFLQKKYRIHMGKRLDLSNPKTFNEKLQWLKLYDRKPEYTVMVDKYAVKDYVTQRIGQERIIPTLGVWDSFEEIDFDSLPDRFVLKCTHDSGGLVICRDKARLDKEKVRRKIEKSLKHKFYYVGREWAYKNVQPRIIAEQFMEEECGGALKDYKIFCFNGEAKVILVCADRFSEGGLRENFYDPDWNLMSVQRPTHPNTDYTIEKPENLAEMLEIAGDLAKGIPFTRVDLYTIGSRVYFGEITFFPASGFQKFSPEEWDLILGSWIKLPEKTD